MITSGCGMSGPRSFELGHCPTPDLRAGFTGVVCVDLEPDFLGLNPGSTASCWAALDRELNSSRPQFLHL